MTKLLPLPRMSRSAPAKLPSPLPCRYAPGRGWYITVPHKATAWQAGQGGPRFQTKAAAETHLLRAKGLGRKYRLGGRTPPPLPPEALLAQGSNPRKS